MNRLKKIQISFALVSVGGLSAGAFIYSLGTVSCRCGTFDSVRADLNSFQSALQAYRKIGGHYPSQEQGLQALLRRPTVSPLPEDWVQAVEDEEVFLDPWGTPFKYLFPGSKDPHRPEVISAGIDRVFGTKDDFSNQTE